MSRDQEIRLEKRLELRNIAIEKLLYGVIVGIVVCFGYAALEDYKSAKAKEIAAYKDQRSQRQSLLQSRLEALFELREAHSRMSGTLYKLMFELPRDRHETEREKMLSASGGHCFPTILTSPSIIMLLSIKHLHINR